MFDTLCELIPRDADYPDRVRQLNILNRVLDGTLYDVLPYHFHEERSESGEYIPLRQRRPNVRYPLSRIVVEDSVSLLFSEGHFPTIDSPDVRVRRVFADIVKETRLNLTMIDAAMRGAVGSVALLLMRILNGRIFVDVFDSTYLTPNWDPYVPDTLLKVDEPIQVMPVPISFETAIRSKTRTDNSGLRRAGTPSSEIWFDRSPVGEPNPLTTVIRQDPSFT